MQMEASVNEIAVSFGLEIPLDRTTSSTKEVFVVMMMVMILMLMMIILAMLMVMISKLPWI